MKYKKSLFIVAAALSISLLSGCDTQSVPQTTTSSLNSGTVPIIPENPASVGTTSTTASVSEQEAKQIALNHAGIAEADASFVKVKQDYDHGRLEYEIEFYVGNQEYDYDIDATTGAVLSFDYDAESYTPAPPATANTPSDTNAPPAANTGNTIEEAKAKEIALSHAGLSEAEVTFIRTKLEYDDGIQKYEIEFYQGNTEYDYDIDAATGTILSFDQDAEYYSAPSTQNQQTGLIGEAKAKEIALSHANVSEANTAALRVQQDYDDGRAEYEVEFYVGRTEYSFEIDAVNGTILNYEVDSD